MRTSIFAMIVVAGSAIAFSATAQERQAAPSEQPKAQIKRDVDKGLKSSGPNEQMQRDSDKGSIPDPGVKPDMNREAERMSDPTATSQTTTGKANPSKVKPDINDVAKRKIEQDETGGAPPK